MRPAGQGITITYINILKNFINPSKMDISSHIDLTSLNTFHIKSTARYFSRLECVDDYLDSTAPGSNILVLGGGSNVLFTGDFDGWVLLNQIKGISVVHEDEDHIYVKAGAGENWHAFVQYCIDHNWAGLENLSLIPGCVGASPMQNIGAYGVEVEQTFWSLEALHLKEKSLHTFTKADCAFGYRESVFKNKYKGTFLITSVTFRLNRKPQFHISYGAIQQELERMGVKDLTLRAVSDAVIQIRRSKLPDPKEIGNAGSFFKNPEVSQEQFDLLKQTFPEIVGYPLAGNKVKLAAGWLIEQCGWKGFREQDAGCHAKQALVLVNYGNATGQQIFDLSSRILDSVQRKFGVALEREVNII